MKNIVKQPLKILISLIILLFLIYSIDINQVKESLINASYFYLGIALILVVINRFIMAFKWNLLLISKGIKKPMLEIAKIYYMSNFLGIFLPPTIGMDTVRIFLLSQHTESRANIVATIVIERIIGIICLLISASVGILFLLQFLIDLNSGSINLLLVIVTISIFSVLFFIVTFNRKLHDILSDYFSVNRDNKILTNVFKSLKIFNESYYSFKNNKSLLIIFGILTFFEIFTVILWSYIIAVGLDVATTFSYFIVFVPILLAIVRLPISIDGFGLNEGGYVYFLGLTGVSSSLAFSVGLINHIIVLIGLLPGGVFYAFRKSEIKKK